MVYGGAALLQRPSKLMRQYVHVAATCHGEWMKKIGAGCCIAHLA